MRRILPVILLLLTQPARAEQDEQAVRNNIEHNAATLLATGQFNTLNKLATQYRTTGERTPSGIWKLSLFYSGLRAPPEADDATEAQWHAAFQKAQDWIQKDPSPAAYIALANLHIGYAWQLRGSGFADTVAQDSWRPFFAELHIADQVLSTNKSNASVDPQWYAEMIELARVEDWPQQKAKPLFDEAMIQGKYYNDVYGQIMQTQEPMWGGSLRAMEDFANDAAERTRDKYGEEMYTRMYWHISGCACVGIGDTLADWSKMKIGFQDALKRYPSQWNVNAFAYFSCLAKDKDNLKLLMRRLKTPVIAQWKGNAAYYDWCRTWASGR